MFENAVACADERLRLVNEERSIAREEDLSHREIFRQLDENFSSDNNNINNNDNNNINNNDNNNNNNNKNSNKNRRVLTPRKRLRIIADDNDNDDDRNSEAAQNVLLPSSTDIRADIQEEEKQAPLLIPESTLNQNHLRTTNDDEMKVEFESSSILDCVIDDIVTTTSNSKINTDMEDSNSNINSSEVIEFSDKTNIVGKEPISESQPQEHSKYSIAGSKDTERVVPDPSSGGGGAMEVDEKESENVHIVQKNNQQQQRVRKLPATSSDGLVSRPHSKISSQGTIAVLPQAAAKVVLNKNRNRQKKRSVKEDRLSATAQANTDADSDSDGLEFDEDLSGIGFRERRRSHKETEGENHHLKSAITNSSNSIQSTNPVSSTLTPALPRANSEVSVTQESTDNYLQDELLVNAMQISSLNDESSVLSNIPKDLEDLIRTDDMIHSDDVFSVNFKNGHLVLFNYKDTMDRIYIGLCKLQMDYKLEMKDISMVDPPSSCSLNDSNKNALLIPAFWMRPDPPGDHLLSTSFKETKTLIQISPYQIVLGLDVLLDCSGNLIIIIIIYNTNDINNNNNDNDDN